MEFSNPLLRRYRSDRRKLLEFLMSSGLIGKITTPAGPITSFSNIDFDAISIDYVLECVQSGGVLDVSEATKRYYFESAHPVMVRNAEKIVPDPRSAGSPPHRVPPSIITHQREFVESRNSQWSNPAGERSPLSSKQVTAAPDINGLHNASILSVGLPTLKTGLLDDDMRESAYEVFLASMLFSGVEIHSTEGKKREKPSKFLAGLKNRRDKRQTERHIESESPERHFKELVGHSVLQLNIKEKRYMKKLMNMSTFLAFSSFRFLLAFLVNCNTSADGQEIYLPIVAHEEAMTGLQANVFEELVSSDDRNTEKQLIGTSLGKIRNAQIAEISRSIILDWVVAQHDRILEWTGRAFDLEDWEPLSLQQKQAASAVEVFRIIEEDLFVADGEGLPRSLVEEQAKFYHQILNLFSLKTESLIRMLMASSEHISVGVSSHKYGQRYLGDAQTLIRVLCHKKDREASMFLKTHYRLPSSSEYDDETAVEDSSFGSPLVSDIWKRSTSFRWSDKEASMSLNRTSYKHLQTGNKPLGPYAASEELYSSQVTWCRGKSRVSETGGMHGAICFGLITEIDLVSFTGFEKDQFMIIEFFVVD
ncbi:UNVERIFIED_CONTAM: protein unc-13 [Sesamum calycinum]|uniref:Protein unc-13 n=1 Tax=Sesamum calycinum TaxID=2727403 RepID=A0AAW2LZM0_9LAMI